MAGPVVEAFAPDGTPILTDAAAVDPHTGRAMTAAESKQAHREADLQQRYGTGLGAVEGVVGPLAAGAARGLSFGLSDVALSKLGGDAARQRLQDYNDFNSIEGNAGELAGVVGGSLLGNYGGIAGIAGRLGRGVEGLAARGLGEGIAGRAVGGALSGALENGLYAAGKQASDSVIADEPLTGQKLVAAGLNGALFGGAIGGALGAAGGALARRGAGAERGALDSIEAVEAPQRGTVGDWLSKQSDVNTIKALGGSAGDIRNIERNVAGGYRRVAQDINADLEATTGKSIGFHDKESLHEYATKRLEEVNKTQADLIKQLDEAKTGLAPKPAEFAQRVNTELVEPHLTVGPDGSAHVLPGQEKSVNAVQAWVDRVNGAFENGQPTFAEWRKMRIGLDSEIKYNASNVTPETAALKKLRGIMEDQFASAGEDAAQSMGSTFRAQYQANKQLTQSLIKAEELTNRGVSRELVNNSVGLRASMGTIAGFAAGNPVMGLLAGAAGKVIKDRGDFMAADLLRRASTLSGVSRLANGVTDAVQSGVRRLVPGSQTGERVLEAGRVGGSAFGVRLTGNRRADFEKVRSGVLEASANPAKTADRISASMGDLPTHAPKTAAAVIHTTLTAAAYLGSLLPPPNTDPYSLQPQLDTRQPSDFEVSKFLRSAQAVDNPLIVLSEAKSGKLSRDHVDAVKAVYPDLYAEMKAQIFEHLVSSKKKLTYQQQVQLGILLDQPTNRTLDPKFISMIQATYAPTDANGNQPASSSPAPDIAGSFQTDTQHAIEGVQ